MDSSGCRLTSKQKPQNSLRWRHGKRKKGDWPGWRQVEGSAQTKRSPEGPGWDAGWGYHT